MPFYDVDIVEAMRDDFLDYTGHVMQERSLPDARDGLKDGARKILYSQFLDKNTYKDRYMKGQAVVGQVLKTAFEHGDASAYSVLVRMGKPFATPYPLEELQGNGGNQVDPDNHAAGRYLECKMSELGTMLFDGIKKNAIEEWYWNYSDTLQLPRVLPSFGFYPIVNGVIGISVGLSTSIPSTNLREVNGAIIKLIQNPEVDFEEIYCAPDFPMGGTIINGAEVKESMKNGCGKAVKIRSKIEYNADKNMLIATEIPFSVYTHTIDAELEKIVNDDEKSGIKKFIDATDDDGAKILIYLEKGANPKRIINRLYKETSLESYYGVNLIMLDNGRFPRIFTWKEALTAYITHIRTCKRREVQFDLDKASARENILNGLVLASNNIDEIVSIIRGSENPSSASEKLIARFGFNEEQTKAILAMRLSALTKIDGIKLSNELSEIIKEIKWCRYLLEDSSALDNELIKVLREVAEKFGDDRRTKVMNIVEKEEAEEQQSIVEDDIQIIRYDNDMLRIIKSGDKVGKQPKNATAIETFYSTNFGSLVCFTSRGHQLNIALSGLEYGRDYSIYELVSLQDEEKILSIIGTTSFHSFKYILFVTKNGMLKKSETNEYNVRGKKPQAAIKLKEKDEVVAVFYSSDETDRIMIGANTGYSTFYNHEDISAIGKNAIGVKAIKLKEDEYVAAATIIKSSISYRGILTINSDGKGKITDLAEYSETSRAVKGNMVQKMDEANLVVLKAIADDCDKLFVEENNKLSILYLSNVPTQSRLTVGNKLIKNKGIFKVL